MKNTPRCFVTHTKVSKAEVFGELHIVFKKTTWGGEHPSLPKGFTVNKQLAIVEELYQIPLTSLDAPT